MIKDLLTLWKIFKRRYPSGLSNSDIVLDVGSGHRPHPRANLLLERFIDDGFQRRGGAFVSEGRPLVVGDVTALPFLNQSIDYIICSHVLEHMTTSAELEMALIELMRVGKRGYIETPSAIAEKILGRSFHHWYVRINGGKIIFVRKRSYREYEELMRGFHSLERDSKTFFRLLYENFDLFYASQKWKGKIDYLIESLPAEDETRLGNDYPEDLITGFQNLDQKLVSKHRFRIFLKSMIHKIKSRKLPVDLFQILACPICKGKVRHNSARKCLFCAECQKEYVVRDGVPIMLVD